MSARSAGELVVVLLAAVDAPRQQQCTAGSPVTASRGRAFRAFSRSRSWSRSRSFSGSGAALAACRRRVRAAQGAAGPGAAEGDTRDGAHVPVQAAGAPHPRNKGTRDKDTHGQFLRSDIKGKRGRVVYPGPKPRDAVTHQLAVLRRGAVTHQLAVLRDGEPVARHEPCVTRNKSRSLPSGVCQQGDPQSVEPLDQTVTRSPSGSKYTLSREDQCTK